MHQNRRVWGDKASGFSLVETLIALTLVGVAMTGLLVAFVGSGKFGVLARRQANAVALGRSIASQLDAAPWGDARLANNNTGNDGSFADPNGRFAQPALPTGAFAPDGVLGEAAANTAFKVGDESYDAYVNVAPDGTTGIFFAVIVRYKVGSTFMRAVVLGYRYNPGDRRAEAAPDMRRLRGFSLIEMFVSMAILAAVVAGISGILIKQSQASVVQAAQRDLEASGRLALPELGPGGALSRERHRSDRGVRLRPVRVRHSGHAGVLQRLGRDRSNAPDELVVAWRDPSFARHAHRDRRRRTVDPDARHFAERAPRCRTDPPAACATGRRTSPTSP